MNNLLDLHGYTTEMAVKEIQKKAIFCYKNKIPYFVVIHGFNHGCVLRDFISNVRNLHCKVITHTNMDIDNMGRTFVWVKKL